MLLLYKNYAHKYYAQKETTIHMQMFSRWESHKKIKSCGQG